MAGCLPDLSILDSIILLDYTGTLSNEREARLRTPCWMMLLSGLCGITRQVISIPNFMDSPN